MKMERMSDESKSQKENVNIDTFWGSRNEDKSLEVENIHNLIRKVAYPYISRAKKLNDMNKPLQLSLSSSGSVPSFLTFGLLPELLPIGKENKSELYLGIKTDADSKSTVIKAKV